MLPLNLRSRGSVLLLSLWATAALAALGIAQATRVSLELKWADRAQEARQAWYLGWAGVELAADRLLSDSELAWDAPREVWAQVPKDPVPFESGTFIYRVSDEQARIALNGASKELLERLPGFTPQAVTELLTRRSAGKFVAHPAELLGLPGFQPDGLDTLEPLVTVQGTGPVNINTASKQVLIQLGLSPTLSDAIVRFRNGADGVWGTSDDGIFPDVEQIPVISEQSLGPLIPEDQLALSQLIGSQSLGVRSSFYRVEVEGRTFRHGIWRKAVAILERSQGQAPVVRGWHEA